MSKKLILIGADHGGYDLKEELKEFFKDLNYQPIDVGTFSSDSVDYPDIAHTLAEAMLEGKADQGILICGSGIGISIAANRHQHIRAALCHDVTTARLCREHNNANVLVLGARTSGVQVAKDCVATFLSTEYEGGRHQQRLDKLSPAHK